MGQKSTSKKSFLKLIKKQKLKIFIVGFLILFLRITGATLLIVYFHFDEKSLPLIYKVAPPPVVDTDLYDRKMLSLANIPAPIVSSTTPKTTQASTTASSTPRLWPVQGLPYPLNGALLPFNRIVAYYGNFYSKKMGILGQYDEDIVLQKLSTDAKNFEIADPTTPVIPAIHYIATTAQRSPGDDGTYMLRMPASQIQKALDLANKAKGIVFLDIQTGNSTLQREIPLLEQYLKLPQVHLGIDPEFAMKNGKAPGKTIGTLDAEEINWAIQYLAKIVRENHIPPKVLVIHRFTKDMVTNYKNIKPLPEVQVVINMDGWGSAARKTGTYQHVIYPEPVQFTGFKIFYGNDTLPPSTGIMTPEQVLKLRPIPSYIQYQ